MRVEDNCFNVFQNQHRNLSSAQCEMILSMRSFYDYLASKGKLFVHAAVIVRNGFAYIIIALASNRKSTLAKQMVANPFESAFLLVGDRIVIGNLKRTSAT